MVYGYVGVVGWYQWWWWCHRWWCMVGNGRKSDAPNPNLHLLLIGSPRTALWSGKADGGCWQGYYYYCYYCFATITFAIATFTIATIGTITLLLLLWDYRRRLQECAMERSQLYPTCRLYTAYTIQITTTLTANSATLHDRFISKGIHPSWIHYDSGFDAITLPNLRVIWMQH